MNNENGDEYKDWKRDLKVIRVALFGKEVADELEDGTFYKKVKQRVVDEEGTLADLTHLCKNCNLLIWTSEPKTHIHSREVACSRILSEEDLEKIIEENNRKEDS